MPQIVKSVIAQIALVCAASIVSGCSNIDKEPRVNEQPKRTRLALPGRANTIADSSNNLRAVPNHTVGDNLRAVGRTEMISRDQIPSNALSIEVHDDNSWIVGGEPCASFERALEAATASEAHKTTGIFLMSESKRAPSDRSLSLLCDFAAAKNVDLFAQYPIGGGELDLNGSQRNSQPPFVRLLVRSRR